MGPRKALGRLDRIRSLGAGLGSLEGLNARIDRIENQVRALRVLAARPTVDGIRNGPPVSSLRTVELSVCSQYGDDGIIQYLVSRTEIAASEERFIEFGVESYGEANTRFLLENNNWRGLIIDGGEKDMDSIRRSELYWKYDLTAVGALVERENVNGLFRSHGFSGRIGLLSIDIDGMDYWVWAAIDEVDPVIVIVEYNAVFGCRRAVTVPYELAFRRASAHWSWLYWGCSLRALWFLARKKGYVFVGCNSAGNNAYFVRQDRLGEIREADPEKDFVEARFRDSRDREGSLTFLSGSARSAAMAEMPLWDVELERETTVREVAL